MRYTNNVIGVNYMERDILTLSVVNFHVNSQSVEANRTRIAEYSCEAAKRGSSLIVFPELSLSGYDYFIDEAISDKEKMNRAETTQDESCKLLSKIATENHILIVFGMPQKVERECYNTAVFIDEEGKIHTYKKIHPFGNEKIFFKKGSEPLMVDTKWGKIGVSICYDTYQFPELLRYYVANGCRLVLNPTAVVEEIKINNSRKSFENYYMRSLEYGALCNEVFIASANLVGYDREHYFGGASAIIGPSLTPFDELDSHVYAGGLDYTQEEMITATIDLQLAKRRLFKPDNIAGETDYRPDVYKKFMM